MSIEEKKTVSVEDQVRAMVPQMTMDICEAIKTNVLQNLQYSMTSMVNDAVKEYISKEILPVVKAELAEQNLTIKAALLAGITGVAEKLSGALVDSATKKLASYEGDKLLANVFGPLFRGHY